MTTTTLADDVADVLRDCPHETHSPGTGVMESENWALETRDGEVVVQWERTWAGSLGGFTGVLSPYFEYESHVNDDDTGGEIRVTSRSTHEHWDET